MKILHILKDGHGALSDQIIDVQSKGHHVEIIDLSKKGISYESLIDKIFTCDKVISW